MCFIDPKKAIDLVNRSFMFQVLEKMDFNIDVFAVIKALYRHTSTSIQVNGHLSDSVDLQQGVRQGCPLFVWCTLYPSLFTTKVKEVSWESNCHIGLPRFLLMQSIFCFSHVEIRKT